MAIMGYAPNGEQIIGTLERCEARAEINGFTKNKAGEWEPDYAGETEVFWDAQQTVQRDGQDIYLDESGNEWTLDQITFKDE